MCFKYFVCTFGPDTKVTLEIMNFFAAYIVDQLNDSTTS